MDLGKGGGRERLREEGRPDGDRLVKRKLENGRRGGSLQVTRARREAQGDEQARRPVQVKRRGGGGGQKREAMREPRGVCARKK